MCGQTLFFFTNSINQNFSIELRSLTAAKLIDKYNKLHPTLIGFDPDILIVQVDMMYIFNLQQIKQITKLKSL